MHEFGDSITIQQELFNWLLLLEYDVEITLDSNETTLELISDVHFTVFNEDGEIRKEGDLNVNHWNKSRLEELAYEDLKDDLPYVSQDPYNSTYGVCSHSDFI